MITTTTQEHKKNNHKLIPKLQIQRLKAIEKEKSYQEKKAKEHKEYIKTKKTPDKIAKYINNSLKTFEAPPIITTQQLYDIIKESLNATIESRKDKIHNQQLLRKLQPKPIKLTRKEKTIVQNIEIDTDPNINLFFQKSFITKITKEIINDILKLSLRKIESLTSSQNNTITESSKNITIYDDFNEILRETSQEKKQEFTVRDLQKPLTTKDKEQSNMFEEYLAKHIEVVDPNKAKHYDNKKVKKYTKLFKDEMVRRSRIERENKAKAKIRENLFTMPDYKE